MGAVDLASPGQGSPGMLNQVFHVLWRAGMFQGAMGLPASA